MHGESCCALDNLDSLQKVGDTIKRYVDRILNSDKMAWVKLDGILQHAFDLVRSDQNSALFFTERIPGGAGLRETLCGMLVTDVFEFTSQPLEIPCELEKS